jgi:hypothetical protein
VGLRAWRDSYSLISSLALLRVSMGYQLSCWGPAFLNRIRYLVTNFRPRPKRIIRLFMTFSISCDFHSSVSSGTSSAISGRPGLGRPNGFGPLGAGSS